MSEQVINMQNIYIESTNRCKILKIKKDITQMYKLWVSFMYNTQSNTLNFL
jgi:hypothetical protein